jgi:hypothetical protein
MIDETMFARPLLNAWLTDRRSKTEGMVVCRARALPTKIVVGSTLS